MAKNNFKAAEAISDPNYAQNVGRQGQGFMETGMGQQAQGFGNLGQTYGDQRNFAQSLQAQAAGTGGPSLAEGQLKQATARNNANAAGMAAGAKGLSPALAARQALMAQAGNNQQAAGQAGQQRIQERLSAQQLLGGALQGQAGTAGGMTQAGLGAAGTGGQLANASNQGLIESRQGANQINADVAKQNAGVLNSAIGGLMNAAGGALTMGLAEGGEVPGYAEGGEMPPKKSFAELVAHHLNEHSNQAIPTNDQVRKEGHLPTKRAMESKRQAAVDSGQVPANYDEGGDVKRAEDKRKQHDIEHASADVRSLESSAHKPKSRWGVDLTDPKHPKPYEEKLAHGGDISYDPYDDEDGSDMQPDTDQSMDEGEGEEHGYADGGNVFQEGPYAQAGSSLGSGFGKLLGKARKEKAADVQRIGSADMLGGAQYTAEGGDVAGGVPGKAQVKGDSLKNDKVHAMLSPGEVVLPRSIAHDPEKAKKFVEHLMQNGGSGHRALKDIKRK